jgi:hypothetical protein
MTGAGTLFLILAAGAAAGAEAAKQDGFRPLFNGRDTNGWQDRAGKAPGKGWVVEGGALARKERAGDLWTKERYGDFVLELEFKTSGNSGVFIRTDNPADNVQTGIEVQVDNPSTKPGKHSCGAVYDCLAPSKNAARKGEWNRLVITAKDNQLTVVMNGEPIVDMDLNRWSEPGKNPDGTRNKFKKALKDFKREGHIGLQDHGAAVSYRNIKIKPLGEPGGR